MKILHSAVVAAACAVFAVGFAVNAFGARPAAGPKAQKGEAYIVIQTGEDYEVAMQSELAPRKKAAADKYKQDMKAYKAAKAEAVKRKEKFDEPPPKHVVPKKVGPTFKTKEQAQEHLEKLVREKEERGTKK